MDCCVLLYHFIWSFSISTGAMVVHKNNNILGPSSIPTHLMLLRVEKPSFFLSLPTKRG